MLRCLEGGRLASEPPPIEAPDLALEEPVLRALDDPHLAVLIATHAAALRQLQDELARRAQRRAAGGEG